MTASGGQKHASANDIAQLSARVVEGFLDDLEASTRLNAGVTGT
jgi:hypothetical protein